MNEEQIKKLLNRKVKIILTVSDRNIFYTGTILEVTTGTVRILDKFEQEVLLNCEEISQVQEMNGHKTMGERK